MRLASRTGEPKGPLMGWMPPRLGDCRRRVGPWTNRRALAVLSADGPTIFVTDSWPAGSADSVART